VAAGAARRGEERARRAPCGARAARSPREHRIGVGVDRLDYTKGILERLNAVARLLEMEPRWIGRFTFVQIAAPSRGTLDDYRDYAGRVRALATAINARYSDVKYPPIALHRRASRAGRRLRVHARGRRLRRD
jgi:trehalose-6-phosphate synthase